ncbi:CHASE2 domain-containing protein [Pseudanabaena sp. PCC 6802]|uniref:CHASE2 domain-containing protein n=1 Tax=Pseudanabaena sp. PCC 6802 TaxID=118173 RepID=UPI00034D07CA|nr:adenylate/guanylate cyclase domain-containing protein [Pseudanabaena sp. PCC 6802]
MRLKLKQIIWSWRGVLIAAPTAAVLVILLRLAGALQFLEWSALDLFFRIAPSESVDPRIIIVGIDESDVRNLNWPITDTALSNLVAKIRQQQPRAIGLDIARDLPVDPGRRDLYQTFSTTPNLFGVEKVPDRDTFGKAALNERINPPPVLKRLKQVAAANLVFDSDAKVRRGLLSLESPDTNEFLLGLGLQTALVYLAKEDKVPHPEAINPERFESNDGGYVNADRGGHQILINYRRGEQPFRTVSMLDVMNDRIPKDLMRNRIVFVGVTAISLKDTFITPLDFGSQTPGVVIHAHIASQLLSGVLGDRAFIKTWSEPMEWLWIIVWTFLGAAPVWVGRHGNTKTSQDRESKLKGLTAMMLTSTNVLSPLSLILLAGTLIGSCYIAFLGGWWIPLVPALMGFGGGMAIALGYVARTAAEIRAQFGRYLTSTVVASLLEHPEGLKFGGERREVTILMCDLRGFSSTSESLPPEEVVKILNIFLGHMTEVIDDYQGTIDEFIGDAILAIFGAPIQQPDDAIRAVACAVAMQQAMEPVNAKIAELNLPEIAMGIGLNSGEVVVGNIGSQTRAKYAVVGSHVNLTSRIESYTVGGQILISESTFQKAGDIVQTYGHMQVEPKGVKQPITIYDVSGVAGEYNLFLRSQENKFVTLKQPIPVQYKVIEDKHLDDVMFSGKLMRLSDRAAELEVDRTLLPLSNIRIHATNLDLSNPTDPVISTVPEYEIYAKVLDKKVDAPNCAYVHFTSMPAAAKDWLSKILTQADLYQ